MIDKPGKSAGGSCHQQARRRVADLPPEDRPLNRLAVVGVRNLSSVELLALVLQTPDALDLAQDILAQLGGLSDLSKMPAQQITSICGVGRARAAQLIAAMEVGRRAMSVTYSSGPVVTNPVDAARLVMTDMHDLEQEQMRIILMNARNVVTGIPTIYMGSVDTTAIRPAELLRPAIISNSRSIILAHNHPSGDPEPSSEDIQLTLDMATACRALEIDFFDHLVIGRTRYVSMRERALGFAKTE